MSKKNFLKKGDVRVYPIDERMDTRWLVKWIDDAGNKRDLKVPSLPTVAERRQAAADIIARISANPNNPALLRRKIPTATAQTAHLFAVNQKRANRLEGKTTSTYKSHINNLDEFCRVKGYNRVTPEVAERFIDFLIAIGRAPRTINSHRNTFSILFKRLKKDKIVKKNPFEGVERVRGSSEPRQYLKSNHIAQIKKTAGWDSGIENACMYLYYLLCRPKELRFIKVEHVDFDNWTVRITWTIGKIKKTRYAVIPDKLRDWMIEHDIASYPVDYYLCGALGLPAVKCVSANIWSEKMRVILRGLGFSKEYVLYSWKNTGAVMWYKAGIGLVEIQRQIGHSSIEQTMIYLKSLGLGDFENVRKNVPGF